MATESQRNRISAGVTASRVRVYLDALCDSNVCSLTGKEKASKRGLVSSTAAAGLIQPSRRPLFNVFSTPVHKLVAEPGGGFPSYMEGAR